MNKKGKKATASKSSGGFNPSDYCKNGLTETEIKSIKEAFDIFDSDGSGNISKRELRDALETLGMDTRGNTFNMLLAEIDKDQNGSIEIGEFIELMTSQLTGDFSREECEKVYKLFCEEQDKDGFEISDLRKVADDLNIKITDEELGEMIKRADLDGDAKVSVEEFYSIMNKQKS